MGYVYRLYAIAFLMATLVGCGGRGSAHITPLDAYPGSDQPPEPNIQYSKGFPDAVPKDALQPWEQLDQNGNAVIDNTRGISTTSPATEFYEGPQTHFESGDTNEWNGALRMASGGVGDGNLSFAMYRIPLGGSEPGVVSVDANLRPMADGSIGGYYIGLADYRNHSWQWFGPITDAHWRISAVQVAREAASFTSGLGSVFICVVAHDGAVLDIVGIGIDPSNPADTDPPPVPSGPSLTPVAGGLLVDWTAFAGGDIAGYKVYFADHAYTGLTAFSAETLPTLHDSLLLLDLGESSPTNWWVALSTVDFSGNESAISSVVTATPFPSEPAQPKVWIEVDSATALINQPIGMMATGASSYDWDLNGDRTFEVMGDMTGTQSIDTSQTGLIRPLVKGTGADATSVALSGVSVIVSSNARPVAVANATPASGNAPLGVTFSGTDSTDFDGNIVGGGWDFDGDGIYDVWDSTDTVHVSSADHTYTTPGVYNAKLRVVDDDGAWDVDTVTVVVDAADADNTPPTADLQGTPTSGNAPLTVAFDAGGSTDSDGTIVRYWWDWDGAGGYETTTFSATNSHTFTTAGSPEVKVLVEDNDGATHTATLTITVNVVGNTTPTATLIATPNNGDVALTATLDSSGSTDGDGSIVNYEWDFDGDGVYDGYGGSSSVNHTYTSAGVFTARVRVTDDSGAQDTATTEVTVNVPGNDSPSANLVVDPTFGDEGVRVTLDASGSNDPDGSIVLYEFDFNGDGLYDANGDSNTASHNYNNHGVFTAKVRVTDDSGAQDTTTADVRVNEVFDLDTPWTSFGRDPRNTRRSTHNSAQTNNVKWTFDTGGKVYGSPTIGADGTVYVGCDDDKLYAIKPDGSLKWAFTTGDIVRSSPAIGSDGTIFFGGTDSKLYALNPSGSLKWSYTLGGAAYSSPVIGVNGTVYVGSTDNKLYAINPDGSQQWSYATGGSVGYSPALGSDGAVYVYSRDDDLYAINPDGTLRWTYTVGSYGSTPSIGSDGTVYVAGDDLYAINPDGTLKWTSPLSFNSYNSTAIGVDGTVYAGGDRRLYAIDPEGNQLWSFNTGTELYSTPAIGADGTVYFGSRLDIFYAFNPDGTEKWSYDTGDRVYSSPAIGSDGTIYVGGYDDKLFAFGTSTGNTPPTADIGVDIPIARTYQTVTFDASGSSDSNGSVVLYEFDFDGDGNYDSSGTSSTATHSYSVQYAYDAVVRVTDNDGATDTAFIQVIITHGPSTMFGHDSLHHSRSPYTGPQANNVSWSTATTGIVYSSPAIGADGSTYVGSWDDKLYAFNPDGSSKGGNWPYTTGGDVWSSPAIGADGTVYIGSTDNKLHAVNPDGSPKWTYTTGLAVYSSPTIGADGAVYVGSYDNNLYAINPSGALRWSYNTGGEIYSSPAIGPDGTLYVGSFDDKLHAINSDGSQKWTYTTGNNIWSSPTVAADGTVYVGSMDNKLHAINPDGSPKWSYTTGQAVYSSPAIGTDGTVYVGSWDDKCYAINPDGSLAWSYTTAGNVESSPTVGADGTIYFGSVDNKVYALTTSGGLLWSFDTGQAVNSSPAIGSDGRVYVGCYDFKLYVFGQ